MYTFTAISVLQKNEHLDNMQACGCMAILLFWKTSSPERASESLLLVIGQGNLENVCFLTMDVSKNTHPLHYPNPPHPQNAIRLTI